MPHHHHGPLLCETFKFRREHAVEKVYVKARQNPSFDTDTTNCGSNCSCMNCQPAVPRGRYVQRALNLFEKEARLVQQNFIQQNINLPSGLQATRRRRSRPVILTPNDDHAGIWICKQEHEHLGRREHRAHRHDPASVHLFCAHGQGGRNPSCHVNDNPTYQAHRSEDEMYNADRAVKKALQAREAVMKEKKKADEVLEKQMAGRQYHMNKILNRKVERERVLPASTLEMNGKLDRAADDIRRRLDQSNADLKQCHERAARKAQEEGRRNREVVLEQENARRIEALRHDRTTNMKAYEAQKKQPKPILVRKKVKFLSSMDMKE